MIKNSNYNLISRTGSFTKAKKHMCEQAQRVMYIIIRKNRNFILPEKCQFDLFYKVNISFTVYGYEFWI